MESKNTVMEVEVDVEEQGLTPEQHRIALVDDDPLFADSLAALVHQVCENHAMARTLDCYHSPTELLAVLQQGRQYDVLFLDIVMDNLDGITLAQKIRAMGIQATIVFVTSTKEYALEGYRVQALQYLVKPVQLEDLEYLFTTVDAQIRRKRRLGTLVIRDRNDYHRVPHDEIEYIEQVGRKAVIHTVSKELGASMTLRELYGKLPQSVFMRCHQGYVVNLQHVVVLNPTQLELRGGACLPVSRSRAKEMKTAFFEKNFEEEA